MTPRAALPLPEFIVLMAVLFAMVAFSIDAMLPALPQIAEELSPGAANRAQLIISSFALGMGVGTLIAGPMADRYGRKAIISGGILLYIAAALLATRAESLEMLLVFRVVQGLGVAGPRIAGQALIRDIYAGRRMAQISSFVMMVFVLVPAFAPYIGTFIIAGFGWRGIFGAFVILGGVCLMWLNLRQPETLPPERRRGLSLREIGAGLREVAGNRLVVIYIAAMTLAFAQLMAVLSTIQQLYGDTYGKVDSFPFWFMFGGLLSGLTTILNGMLVMRLGMRTLAMSAFLVQFLISGACLIYMAATSESPPFGITFLWVVTLFGMAGLTFGNLTALALEPMGHIAGLAASLISAVSTIVGIAIAAPIGLGFDGTPRVLLIGTLICSLIAYLIIRHARALDPEPKTSAALAPREAAE